MNTIRDMGSAELLGLLALLIALSAYLGSIRASAIERLHQVAIAERRSAIKLKLLIIAITDAPLVVSAVLLALHLFYADLFAKAAPDWLLRWSIYFAAAAGVLLVANHVYAWAKSLHECMDR